MVRNVKAAEQVVVETVLAKQQLVNSLQEQTTFSTLNDAVVVCARHRHNLRHTKRVEIGFVGALEFSGVINGANTNDHALTRHESWDRLHGADGARVRNRDVGALEVGDCQLVGFDFANDVVISNEKSGEIKCVCIAKNRHDQRASPITLVDVDRQTHIDVRITDEQRLSVSIKRVRVTHVGHCICDCANNCIRDDVRERHFAQAMA